MQKLLFVFNPHTGGGKLKNRLLDILCKFSQAGYELSVWPTGGRGDAREIVKNHAEGCDLVVCCGGDGTMNEVVDGLMQLKAPPTLGYIPGGTTNDFAASLLLPKSDMMKAVDRILNPRKIFHCDVGSFNGRGFNYVAGFGAFTDVSYSTPQNIKNALGYFAYLLEAVQQLPSLDTCKVKLQCEGETHEGDYVLGMVSNSASIGGLSFPNKHKVRLDDGLFEVILVRMPHSLGDLGALAAAMRSGNYTSDLLTVLRAEEIEFSFGQEVPWTLDGEYGGSYNDVHIKVRHKALKICI